MTNVERIWKTLSPTRRKKIETRAAQIMAAQQQ